MRINFFEEFPTAENLNKAALVSFPAIVFVAAKSLEEFIGLRDKLLEINPKLTAGYWPILASSYWLSPFADQVDLKNLRLELANYRGSMLPILLDLELPLFRPKYIIKNLFRFAANKKLIVELMESDKPNIILYTAEYPLLPGRWRKLLRFLALSFSPSVCQNKQIFMAYQSLAEKYRQKFGIDFSNRIKRFLQAQVKDENQIVGLGSIASGIFSDRFFLTPDQLEAELDFCRNLGVEEVTIFRLGGLSQEHINACEKFVSPGLPSARDLSPVFTRAV